MLLKRAHLAVAATGLLVGLAGIAWASGVMPTPSGTGLVTVVNGQPQAVANNGTSGQVLMTSGGTTNPFFVSLGQDLSGSANPGLASVGQISGATNSDLYDASVGRLRVNSAETCFGDDGGPAPPTCNLIVRKVSFDTTTLQTVFKLIPPNNSVVSCDAKFSMGAFQDASVNGDFLDCSDLKFIVTTLPDAGITLTPQYGSTGPSASALNLICVGPTALQDGGSQAGTGLAGSTVGAAAVFDAGLTNTAGVISLVYAGPDSREWRSITNLQCVTVQ